MKSYVMNGDRVSKIGAGIAGDWSLFRADSVAV